MHYYFASYEKEIINIIREATEKEYLFLKERLSRINKMLLDKKRIENFVRCYEKILNQYNNCNHDTNLREVCEELNADLAAYLGSFKKFSDNWQTAIIREYGKNSNELAIFSEAFAEQYDQYMEYRIVYRLRNYDQHCGDIVSKVTAFMEGEKTVYKAYMDRDYLLTNFKEWKKEEIEYLSKCNELIEILPVFKVFHRCVLKAFEGIMRIHINENISKCCAEILNFTNDISANDVIYIWVDKANTSEHADAKENISVNITCIDKKLCASILKMYIRANRHIVKILYHGEKIGEKICDCANYVEKDNFKNVNSQSPFFVINGKRYISLISRRWLETGDFYGVYADAKLKKADRDRLYVEYKEYLQALLGK